jgi:hypothetical protein
VLKAIMENHPDELEVVAFNDIGDLPTTSACSSTIRITGASTARWKSAVMH